MNYELLYKLAIEENDKLKSEVITLRKRNERLNLEIDKVESLIKNIQDEKEEEFLKWNYRGSCKSPI